MCEGVKEEEKGVRKSRMKRGMRLGLGRPAEYIQKAKAYNLVCHLS